MASRQSRTSARSRQLKEALAKRRVVKGNHTIEVNHGLLAPEKNMCTPCSLNMVCYLQGAQVTYGDAVTANAPCIIQDQTIRFMYHATTCLVYDVGKNSLSDYGMWGHSMTTSQSIGGYLEALWSNDLICGDYDMITYLKKCFKKLHDGGDVVPDGKFVTQVTTTHNDICDGRQKIGEVTWLHLV